MTVLQRTCLLLAVACSLACSSAVGPLSLEGQISVLFVMVVAAAEVTVGLAIIVAVFRKRATASVDELSGLKG